MKIGDFGVGVRFELRPLRPEYVDMDPPRYGIEEFINKLGWYMQESLKLILYNVANIYQN